MSRRKTTRHKQSGLWGKLDKSLPILAVVIIFCNLAALFLWFQDHQKTFITIPTNNIKERVQFTPPLPDLLTTPVTVITPHLNGIPTEEIIRLTPETIQNIREIYMRGLALERNQNAFSKIGDSTIESPHFMDAFDNSNYELGPYDYLQPVVEYYSGSFARQGEAVQRGLHSWTVFDPMWANNSTCQPDEGPIHCEIRLHNPSIMLIRLGSNDVGQPELFKQNLEELVQYLIEDGIIPVIGTKADRNEGLSNNNNQVMKQIADDYHLPFWDFDRVAPTLPNNGMRADGVHLTFFPSNDYSSPESMESGYAIHNLTALMMLYEILRILSL